jgi:hypothetical protein
MQRGRLAFCLALALFTVATTAAPSSADMPRAYSARFPHELTLQTSCPPGVLPPPSSFCFTGSDHSGEGTSTPPGPHRPATEDFTGFVDFTSPIANACPPNPGSTTPTAGFPEHSKVTIGTTTGKLFMTTQGVDCISTGTDDASWQVVGGTRRFRDTAGTGTIHTQATGGTGTAADPIRSASTYSGQLARE